MASTKQTSSPLRFQFILEFLRDVRVLQVIGQIIFVILVVAALSQLASTAGGEMRARNLTPTFTFLQNRAGFEITESPEWYSTNSSYGDAMRVGIINTLRVVSAGLVLSTVIGVFAGIFLLSTNWLIRTISRVYVEILRNTPLLVQLFVWYYIVMFSLPQPRQAITMPAEGVVFITLRLALYALLYFLIWRSLRHLHTDAPRRLMTLTGFFAAAFVTEVAFYLHYNQAAWAGLYGRGDLVAPAFMVYFGFSFALIGAAYIAPLAVRPYALGATIGQLIGGLLVYFGIMPDAAFRVELYPAVYLSIRGLVFPEILPTARFAEWMAFVVFGIVAAIMMWVYFRRVTETTGRPIPRLRYALLTIIALAAIGWFIVGSEPLPEVVPVAGEDGTTLVPLSEALEDNLLTAEQTLLYTSQPIVTLLPEQNRLGRFIVGTEFSPEYAALLLGLVVYTSAFIAEIVRAGIQAVPYGQIEAARAVGLKQSQTLSQVILPQALRVIIPPLGNQYLNLAKNSSLAIAIAFADMFTTMTTVMNQSGQSVTGIVLVMGFYLAMSLIISLVMNVVNARFQLVTR